MAERVTGSDYVLWGSAGHAKVLGRLITLTGGRVLATIDNDPEAEPLPDVPLHVGEAGFERWAAGLASRERIRALVAIGGHRGRDRLAIQTLFARLGFALPPVVHPHSSVCATARLGAGTQVLAQALVAADTVIGAAGIVNHRASVDHECVLGDGVHLAPGAVLCGCVRVGDNVLIGAGAVVLPRLTIGQDAQVGAGAVVTRDVSPGTVVLGNPARVQEKE